MQLILFCYMYIRGCYIIPQSKSLSVYYWLVLN